jgi:hypothetical protein
MREIATLQIIRVFTAGAPHLTVERHFFEGPKVPMVMP